AEMGSAGLAAQRYAIYLEGVEAAMKKTKAAWEGVWQKTIYSETIKMFYGLSEGAARAVSNLGGLIPVVVALGVALAVLTRVKIEAFFVALYASLGPIGIALTVLGAVIFVFAGSIKTLAEKFQELADEAKKTADVYEQLKSSRDSVKSLWEEMEILRKKTELTTDEAKRLAEIYNQLNELSGGRISGSYDAELNFRVDENALLQDTINLLNEELAITREIGLETARAAALAGEAVSKANQHKIVEQQEIIDTRGSEGYIGMGAGSDSANKRVADDQKTLRDLDLLERQHALDVLKVYQQLTGWEERETFRRTITSKAGTDAIEKYIREQSAKTRTQEKLDYERMLYDEWAAAHKMPAFIEPLDPAEFLDSLGPIQDGLEKLNSIKATLSEGKLPTDDLTDLGLEVERVGEQWVITEESQQAFIDGLKLQNIVYKDLSPEMQSYVDNMIAMATATDDGTDSLDELASAMSAVTAAQEEQADTGYISAETAINLIAAHASLIPYLTQTADGFYLDAEGARAALYAEMELIFTNNGLATAAVAAAKGNYILAASLITISKDAAPGAKKQLLDLLAIYAAMGANISMPNVGGSGGSGKSAAEKAADELKKVKEDEKDQLNDQLKDYKKLNDAQKEYLKDQLDGYKKIIDARKELLQSLKDEQDYKTSLSEKEEDVSKIKREIIELSFDTSQEAVAKRLTLSEELAKKQADLDKLQSDKAYDDQMNALDKEEKTYEDFINAQIAMLDSQYKLYEDSINSQISIIDYFLSHMEDLISRMGGGGGGSSVGSTSSKTPVAGGHWEQDIGGRGYHWVSDTKPSVPEPAKPTGKGTWEQDIGGRGYHWVAEHHEGVESGFVGGLKSNEQFVKALKGELLIKP
ncbi:hypothetical protein IMZ68_05095, partial [Candidatus Bathyarchaeota archaeon]|nr:hypothetical protein [Candidatus Bathyarchaeota archaeon]